jgi:hypothetical protein
MKPEVGALSRGVRWIRAQLIILGLSPFLDPLMHDRYCRRQGVLLLFAMDPS